jgi:hypothetical protein
MLYESCLLLVREDTITSKVFVRALDLPTCGLDTVETLLYDYNWQLDDSVHSYVETNHFIHYVSAIDSTLINATWHKVWHFKYTFTAFISSRDYDVIEGIGCTQSLLFPLHPVAFESHDKLICFENNSSTPAVSPTVSGYFNNTTSCSLSIEDLPAHYAKSSVVPNPINESATLRLPKRLNSGTLKIYNAVGQLITEMPFQNKTELPIGDKIYVHSLYYYQVTGADGEVYTGKFTF